MYDPREADDLTEIRKLYPQMSDDELRTAKYNLRRYLTALVKIEERLQKNGKSLNDRATAVVETANSLPPMTNPKSVIHINFPIAGIDNYRTVRRKS